MDDFQVSKEIVSIEPKPTPDEDRDAMLVDLKCRLTLLELGVMSYHIEP